MASHNGKSKEIVPPIDEVYFANPESKGKYITITTVTILRTGDDIKHGKLINPRIVGKLEEEETFKRVSKKRKFDMIDEKVKQISRTDKKDEPSNKKNKHLSVDGTIESSIASNSAAASASAAETLSDAATTLLSIDTSTKK